MTPVAEDCFLHEWKVRFFGFWLQTRTTVVRLSGNRLFVHSPAPPDRSLRAELERLGEVAFVVSPNKIHNQGLAAFAEAYPKARFFASPGLPDRRPELRFDGVLGDAPEPDWAAEMDQAATRGNVFFSEILFLHRASRTLIVADLVENIDARTASLPARILAAPFGVRQRPMASPELRLYTDDAAAAARSLERPRRWDFERIVVAHGGLIDRDAQAVFGSVCDELVASARRRSRPARATFTWLARLQ